ncbi:hypothetical protein PTKIN_Ptkin07bG0280000 [Pterospermum kingtungense]
MDAGGFHDAVPGVALSTAVSKLLEAILGVIKTTRKFKPVLDHLNDTVNWITPRIKEISQSTNSKEIERLLSLLNQAKETVDKCYGVSWWNYYRKYQLAKKLIKLDKSIRTTLQVFFPVMILEDTRQILDSVDELKLMVLVFFYIMLEDFRSGAKFSSENLGLEKIFGCEPAEIVNDIALWKRKKLSGSLLFISTANWVLQQVYEYNFVTIASLLAIFVATSLFIWRYVNKFVNREEEAKSKLENIREQVAMETANACWELTDKVIGWIFHVTDVEREWSAFPLTVVILLIFCYMGSFVDLPTLCRGIETWNYY